MSGPYYADESVTLYHGDCREILEGLVAEALVGVDFTVDAVITDPPYGDTSLNWDRWPDGWPDHVAEVTRVMWCFGSLRMFLDHRSDFGGWTYGQDIIWKKHNGSGFMNDRFRRVHEHAVQWYQPPWSAIYKDPQTTNDATARTVRRKGRPPHLGEIGDGTYTSVDGGPRLMLSVLEARSMHGSAIHPTEKPVGILEPLIRYSCPPGGLVLDPFAGSGSTLDAARVTGRRAIGIEADERYCEAIANRLAQAVIA